MASAFRSSPPSISDTRSSSCAIADFSLSIRYGLGQVSGINQCHLGARPDFHAVYDRAGNRSEEDRGRVILFAAGGQLAVGSVLGMLVLSGHPAD